MEKLQRFVPCVDFNVLIHADKKVQGIAGIEFF